MYFFLTALTKMGFFYWSAPSVFLRRDLRGQLGFKVKKQSQQFLFRGVKKKKKKTKAISNRPKVRQQDRQAAEEVGFKYLREQN